MSNENAVKPPQEIKPLPRLEFKAPTLAPSRLDALSECAGYIGDILDKDTDAADEGTLLHKCVEQPDCPEAETLTPEQRDLVAWCQEKLAECPPGWYTTNYESEVQVDVPFCARPARLDVVRFNAVMEYDAAQVIDWKFGRKRHKPAHENPQLHAYGAGLMLQYPRLERLILTLAYPRLDFVDSYVFTREDFKATMERLAKQSVKCDDYLAHLSPGSACGYCGRKLQCPAVAKLASTVGFPIQMGRTDLYDPKQLADLRRAAGVLEKFAAEVKQWTGDAAMRHGVDLPGFKLVEKRGDRVLRDVTQALKLLPEIQAANGLPSEFDIARLLDGVSITQSSIETYLTEMLRAAHDGKPPRGSLKKITTALEVELTKKGLVTRGKPSLSLQEI